MIEKNRKVIFYQKNVHRLTLEERHDIIIPKIIHL